MRFLHSRVTNGKEMQVECSCLAPSVVFSPSFSTNKSELSWFVPVHVGLAPGAIHCYFRASIFAAPGINFVSCGLIMMGVVVQLACDTILTDTSLVLLHKQELLYTPNGMLVHSKRSWENLFSDDAGDVLSAISLFRSTQMDIRSQSEP